MSNLPKTKFKEPTKPKSFRLPVDPEKRTELTAEIYETISVYAAKSNALPTYNKKDSDFMNKVQDQAMSNSELGKTKEDQFREKYIDNAFFWIENEKQADLIQDILLGFGLLNPIGGKSKISWHEGFKNLCTFPPTDFKNYSYFQKTNVWFPNARYGNPVNYEQFLSDFEALNTGI